MSQEELLRLLKECPLVASVQAADGSPVQHTETLCRLAEASRNQGVKVLRLQGAEAISAIKKRTGLPVIGLIKRTYRGSDVYITPTVREVKEIVDAGAEIVALDGTQRKRPKGESLTELVREAHDRGALVLADIDSAESAQYASSCGVDLVSTTLAGYTDRSSTVGPDLELLRQLLQTPDPKLHTLAEGRFDSPWQVEAALRIGAAGVVVGGALNDPDKNTKRFMPRAKPTGRVGAVDIGGTWIRFGLFSPEWQLLDSERELNPKRRRDRIKWIRERVERFGVSCLGVGTGGIVDPATGEVWAAKEYLMPDHIGLRFDEQTFGVPTFAFGDGHATAWGHACLPEFAGKRVATLALGTGVGCGFVQENRIWSGSRGEYPRINDLPAPGGASYESLLGGFHLTQEASSEQMAFARIALTGALGALRTLYFPDEIVIAGSVGLSSWLRPAIEAEGVKLSPFGADAGLYGAAALALFPCWN